MPDRPHDDARSDAFQQSLDDMLERVSDSIRAEHVVRDRMRVAHAKRAARVPAPVRAPVGPSAAVPPVARDRGAARRVALGAVALLGIGAAVAWTVPWQPVPETSAMRYESLPPPAAGRPQAAPLAPRPAVERATLPAIAVDADASTESLMLDQLGRAGGGATAADAAATAGAPPAFAIARYDTLHATGREWHVLAPLHVEEVYAIVPVASPLRGLGDLQGRRINVGEPGSARATSGAALYRELFGRELPGSTFRSAPRDAALRALLNGDGLDALVYFDGQPSMWLESLPVETRRRLRLLGAEPGGTPERRALRTYLRTSLASGLSPDGKPVPTLGEVSFLVAAPQAARTPRLLQDLCERLPLLRARGHPKWKDVDPTLQLPVNLQRAPELTQALQACRSPAAVNPSPVLLSGANP